MKILKIVLMLVGGAMIIYGVYNIFVPQEMIEVAALEANVDPGFSNQTAGMIGIGVFALIAGILIRNRK